MQCTSKTAGDVITVCYEAERSAILLFCLCSALSRTIRPQFADAQIHFGAEFGRKGLTNVSQILTQSRRDMGCPVMQKKSCDPVDILPF